MVIIKYARALLGLRRGLFSGGSGSGWRVVVTRNGRVSAKCLRMLDGTLSWAGAGKGFIIIYGQSGTRDLRSLCPMHLLLEASIENLSRFYSPEQACEIYSVYKRFNRIRSD